MPITPVNTERGESSVHCFNCQEPGHNAPQCPHKQKGKLLAINTINAEVQLVTTRSKAKIAKWEEQEEIRKAIKERVTKANETNVRTDARGQHTDNYRGGYPIGNQPNLTGTRRLPDYAHHEQTPQPGVAFPTGHGIPRLQTPQTTIPVHYTELSSDP